MARFKPNALDRPPLLFSDPKLTPFLSKTKYDPLDPVSINCGWIPDSIASEAASTRCNHSSSVVGSMNLVKFNDNGFFAATHALSAAAPDCTFEHDEVPSISSYSISEMRRRMLSLSEVILQSADLTQPSAARSERKSVFQEVINAPNLTPTYDDWRTVQRSNK